MLRNMVLTDLKGIDDGYVTQGGKIRVLLIPFANARAPINCSA